jgi:hypothetical protein
VRRATEQRQLPALCSGGTTGLNVLRRSPCLARNCKPSSLFLHFLFWFFVRVIAFICVIAFIFVIVLLLSRFSSRFAHLSSFSLCIPTKSNRRDIASCT